MRWSLCLLVSTVDLPQTVFHSLDIYGESFPLRVLPFFMMSSEPHVGQLKSNFIPSFLSYEH